VLIPTIAIGERDVEGGRGCYLPAVCDVKVIFQNALFIPESSCLFFVSLVLVFFYYDGFTVC